MEQEEARKREEAEEAEKKRALLKEVRPTKLHFCI